MVIELEGIVNPNSDNGNQSIDVTVKKGTKILQYTPGAGTGGI